MTIRLRTRAPTPCGVPLAFFVTLGATACTDLSLIDSLGEVRHSGGSTSTSQRGGATASGDGSSSGTAGRAAPASGGSASRAGADAALGGTAGRGGATPELGAAGSDFTRGGTQVLGGAGPGAFAGTSGSVSGGTGNAFGGAATQAGQGLTSTSGSMAQAGASDASRGAVPSSAGGMAQGGAAGGIAVRGGAGGSSAAAQAGAAAVQGGAGAVQGGAGAVQGGAGAVQGGAGGVTTNVQGGAIGSSTSARGGAFATCPNRITKSATLRAHEPIPNDPCARVTTVSTHLAGYSYAFGFSNGEIHSVTASSPTSGQRLDLWNAVGVERTLPAALVSALHAPRSNNEGALFVGYANPLGGTISPWFTANGGAAWNERASMGVGPTLNLFECPFHTSSHFLMTTPWNLWGYSESSRTFDFDGADPVRKHLQMNGPGTITATEVVAVSNGFLVYVGAESGELYRSNLLSRMPVWNEALQGLDVPVTWTRITTAAFPGHWVTRIAVHPQHPERMLVTFAVWGNGEALWYSADGGTNWANWDHGLPTQTSAVTAASPLIGATFNPFVDGVAYVVTPQTAYYTDDAGASWHEW